LGFPSKKRKQLRINILWILLSIVFSYSILTLYNNGYGIDFFFKDESPFGLPYDLWVASWWNWNGKIAVDPVTQKFVGLQQNGCLVNKENSVVMLVDTAAKGQWNQKCKISHNEGILIPIWTGECDWNSEGYNNKPHKELLDCARGFDLGKVSGQVIVDGKRVALLDVVDLNKTINAMENVPEINTRLFNLTYNDNNHLVGTNPTGTYPTAAHGWFVFLKPLSTGNHTIYYQNSVEDTSVAGSGNLNAAELTYQMEVE
jgi:hypothetical protein